MAEIAGNLATGKNKSNTKFGERENIVAMLIMAPARHRKPARER
jgi:hypothetical protein